MTALPPPSLDPTGRPPVLFDRTLAVLAAVAVPLLFLFSGPLLEPALSDSGYADATVNRAGWEALAEPAPPADLRLEGDWERVDGTAVLVGDPGDAAVIVEVELGYWDRAEVMLRGAPGSKWRLGATLAPPVQGADVRRLLVPDVESGYPVEFEAADFPQDGALPTSVSLRFEPRESGAVLASVRAHFRSERLNRLPFLPDRVAAALLPFLVAALLRVALGAGAVRAGSGGAAAGLIALFLLLNTGDADRLVWGLAAGTALAAGSHAVLAARHPSLRRRGIAGAEAGELRQLGLWLLGTGAVLLALGFRWDAFVAARPQVPPNDAVGYIAIALGEGGLYQTSQDIYAPFVREPLFPWLLELWFALVPNTFAAARFGAMLVSVAAVAAFYAVGVRLFGSFVGTVAAGWIATRPEWAELGVSVLRLDVLVIGLCGLIACRAFLENRAGFRAAGWGVAGAALVLTRLSSIGPVIPLMGWEFWRRRWHPGEVALAVALLTLPVLPHLRFNAQEGDGDPFYSSTFHTRFYLNRAHLDEPGWPTREEFRAFPYEGEPISVVEYFFRYHSIPELVAGHAVGAWNVFVWKGPREILFDGHEWLMLPGLLGGILLLRDRRRWITAWFVLVCGPYFFIHSQGASWRLGAEAQLLALWVWAFGVRAAGAWGGAKAKAWIDARRSGMIPQGEVDQKE